MKVALQDTETPEFEKMWPSAAEYWPKLKANTLIAGIPYLEPDKIDSYYTRRNSQQISSGGRGGSIFGTIKSNLSAFIDTSIPLYRSRLLDDEEENKLQQ